MAQDSLIIATHDGKPHSDDVLAMAILTTIYPNHCVLRSRDYDVLETADIVFDVGGCYDPETHRYDHHMPDPPRDKHGHLYSSAGLIWKHYSIAYLKTIGMPQTFQIGDYVYDLFQLVEKEMRVRWIYPIDRVDNGISHSPTPIGELVNIMRPIRPERTREKYDALFLECVSMVSHLFKRACFKSADYLIDKYVCQQDEKTLECDGKVLISKTAIGNYKNLSRDDVHFVISPVKEYVDSDPYFSIRAMTATEGDTKRYLTGFPKEWWGCGRHGLRQFLPVSGVKYCHHTGFLLLTDTQEAAVEVCKYLFSLS